MQLIESGQRIAKHILQIELSWWRIGGNDCKGRKPMESGRIESGGMAERLNAPVLKTDFAIPASTRK